MLCSLPRFQGDAVRKLSRVVVFTIAIACAAGSAQAGVDRFTSISPEGASISWIVIDPLKPSTIYAAASHAGVFKSVDSGENWTLVFDSASVSVELTGQRVVGPMVIDPTHPSKVYAAIASREKRWRDREDRGRRLNVVVASGMAGHSAHLGDGHRPVQSGHPLRCDPDRPAAKH